MRNDLIWEDHLGKGSISIIEDFENKIRRKFPPSYKIIVAEHDAAYVRPGSFKFYSNLVADEVVFGVGVFIPHNENSDGAMTMDQIQRYTEGLTEGLVAFSSLGNGDLLCFDYRGNTNTNNPPIAVWHHEGRPGMEEEVSPVAKTFDEFLDMLFEEQ